MASLSDHCLHCNVGDRDRSGAVKHEAWCPLFMRGPDAGGDPAEWPTLLEPCPTCEELIERGVKVTCEAGQYPGLERPKRRRTYNDHRLIAVRRELEELRARHGRRSQVEELEAELERRQIQAAIDDEEA